MKINLVQETIEVKYYVAEDGSVFRSEAECRQYERTVDNIEMVRRYNVLSKKYCLAKDIRFLPCIYNYDADVHIMRIHDSTDVDILNDWFARPFINSYNTVSLDDIGKVIVLVYTDDRGRDYDEANHIDMYYLDELSGEAWRQAYNLKAEV